MPTFIFSCESGHSKEIFKQTPYKNAVRKRCTECGLWMYRDYQAEHSSSKSRIIHLDHNKEPISHTSKKRGFKGQWVEHAAPNPVFVKDHKEYMDLLKKTHSVEKTTNVGR